MNKQEAIEAGQRILEASAKSVCFVCGVDGNPIEVAGTPTGYSFMVNGKFILWESEELEAGINTLINPADMDRPYQICSVQRMDYEDEHGQNCVYLLTGIPLVVA